MDEGRKDYRSHLCFLFSLRKKQNHKNQWPNETPLLTTDLLNLFPFAFKDNSESNIPPRFPVDFSEVEVIETSIYALTFNHYPTIRDNRKERERQRTGS